MTFAFHGGPSESRILNLGIRSPLLKIGRQAYLRIYRYETAKVAQIGSFDPLLSGIISTGERSVPQTARCLMLTGGHSRARGGSSPPALPWALAGRSFPRAGGGSSVSGFVTQLNIAKQLEGVAWERLRATTRWLRPSGTRASRHRTSRCSQGAGSARYGAFGSVARPPATTAHAGERMAERTVTAEQMADAHRRPLHRKPTRADAGGKRSCQLIGRDAGAGAWESPRAPTTSPRDRRAQRRRRHRDERRDERRGPTALT